MALLRRGISCQAEEPGGACTVEKRAGVFRLERFRLFPARATLWLSIWHPDAEICNYLLFFRTQEYILKAVNQSN